MMSAVEPNMTAYLGGTGQSPAALHGAAVGSNANGDKTAAVKHDPAMAKLREMGDKIVGSVFYGTLLKQMRTSELKGEYGHGGRGEEVFGAQLHAELAQRAATGQGAFLSDAIIARYGDQTARMNSQEGRIS